MFCRLVNTFMCCKSCMNALVRKWSQLKTSMGSILPRNVSLNVALKINLQKLWSFGYQNVVPWIHSPHPHKTLLWYGSFELHPVNQRYRKHASCHWRIIRSNWTPSFYGRSRYFPRNFVTKSYSLQWAKKKCFFNFEWKIEYYFRSTSSSCPDFS